VCVNTQRGKVKERKISINQNKKSIRISKAEKKKGEGGKK
jgi:hypothetical protein